MSARKNANQSSPHWLWRDGDGFCSTEANGVIAFDDSGGQYGSLGSQRLLKRSWANGRGARVADEALTRGAAIAIYAATSIAPLLLIVVAIAGLVFGHDVALTAITDQLSGLMGKETATFLNTAVSNASKPSSGILAAAIGVITLIATASGVFGEMHCLGAVIQCRAALRRETITSSLRMDSGGDRSQNFCGSDASRVGEPACAVPRAPRS